MSISVTRLYRIKLLSCLAAVRKTFSCVTNYSGNEQYSLIERMLCCVLMTWPSYWVLRNIDQTVLHLFLTYTLTCTYKTCIWWEFSLFHSVLGQGEMESTWYVSCYLVYCTSFEWWMSVEQLVERLAGETEVVGEGLPRYQLGHHKSHTTWP
jgi:hypothetical protein